MGENTYANHLLSKALKSDANGFSFQVRDVNFYKKFKKYKLKDSFYLKAAKLAKKYNKEFGISIKDINKVSFFEDLDVSFYKIIENDLENSVFSYIPNTAEVSFYGMVQKAQDYMNRDAEKKILKEGEKISKEKLRELLSQRPRIEKVAIKDAKLRTFITDDSSRDELVRHVYDVTYGSIKNSDNLVIIDDSIVRGTTLQKSIIKMLDRLSPKKIIIVSSAPQIRYPDCYGIDMAKMTDLIAFRAAIKLLKGSNKENIIKRVYENCLLENKKEASEIKNIVKQIYEPYSDKQISSKISF